MDMTVGTVQGLLAAVGLTADQVGAALTHGRRGEYRMIGINAILVAMAVRILMVL